MRKIIVWGIGNEYRKLERILKSSEIMLDYYNTGRTEYEIIGFCDQDEEKGEYVSHMMKPEDIVSLCPKGVDNYLG